MASNWTPLIWVATTLLGLHAISATSSSQYVEDLNGYACICGEQEGLVFMSNGCPAGCQTVASGAYVDLARTQSNFGKLRVVANDTSVPAADRYRAAGFLEGYLTAVRIWHHFNNMKAYFETVLYPGVNLWGVPMDWLQQQEAWTREQIAASQQGHNFTRAEDAFMQQAQADPDPDLNRARVLSAVELLLAQFDGLVEGYAARVAAEHARGAEGQALLQPMQRQHHMFMQNNGELYDIVDGWLAGAWSPDTNTTPVSAPPNSKDGNADAAAWKQRWSQSRSAAGWLSAVSVAERCSALIKVTGDLSDLLIGHATWDTFTNMLRIYKHLELGSPGFGTLSFSSYPGETFSDDDFYLSESGLVVLETTNHVFNMDVYRQLTPASLLSWQRVRAALLVASSGDAWAKAFSMHNSGTYNNEYMVVDTNKFKPKVELAPGLLWVIEQLPGLIVASDATDMLARGYWASYNVPYFSQIYNMSGYPDVLSAMQRDQANEPDVQHKQHYEVPIRWLRYQTSPRAAIFRRDQAAAENLDSFKNLMRYNNYLKDSYSHGASLAAVCGRADLPHLKDLQLVQAGRRSQDPQHLLKRQGRDVKQAGTLLAKHRVPKEPKGCYDGKVTSYAMARQLVSEVVNGPTTSHGLPSFSWDAWSDASSPMGHPRVFNFTWERMSAGEVQVPPMASRTQLQ